jgi:hypothetical protein
MGNILSKFAKKIEQLPEVDFSISTTGMTTANGVRDSRSPAILNLKKKENAELAKREWSISVTMSMLLV